MAEKMDMPWDCDFFNDGLFVERFRLKSMDIVMMAIINDHFRYLFGSSDDTTGI